MSLETHYHTYAMSSVFERHPLQYPFIHTHSNPLLYTSHLCVFMEQCDMSGRKSQPIGTLRPGKRWTLHWNSALGSTGPRTSSCSWVTVREVAEVQTCHLQMWPPLAAQPVTQSASSSKSISTAIKGNFHLDCIWLENFEQAIVTWAVYLRLLSHETSFCKGSCLKAQRFRSFFLLAARSSALNQAYLHYISGWSWHKFHRIFLQEFSGKSLFFILQLWYLSESSGQRRERFT